MGYRDFPRFCCRKMFVLGILLAAFGATFALDMSGCRPSQPKVIQTLSGEISSPGFSSGVNYPNNLHCEYVIKALFGFRIQLTLLDLDVEPADMCMRDAVEVYEIDNQGRRSITAVFCGNQTYPQIISRSSVVSIVFRSDFMVRHKGFRMKWFVSGMPLPCNIGQVPCRNRKCYNPINKCDGKDDCGDGTDEEGCGRPLAVTECGIRKASGVRGPDRVIGGDEAAPGSWPWQADLQLAFIHPNGHTCGGTLINSQWVLSAAHCFMQFRHPSAFRIHLGNHHKYKKDSTEQVRFVERIILYPGTTGDDLMRLPDIDMMNDISLIKLNAPVTFTDAVRPACMPNQGRELAVGTKCMASGWGMTRGTGSDHVLKEIDLTVQTAKVCDGQSGPMRPDTMICVKNEKGYQDVCHGDSGGPLVCELNGKWNIMGATSYGSQGNYVGGLCAMTESATIYAKVSHKTNWINQMIRLYS